MGKYMKYIKVIFRSFFVSVLIVSTLLMTTSWFRVNMKFIPIKKMIKSWNT